MQDITNLTRMTTYVNFSGINWQRSNIMLN